MIKHKHIRLATHAGDLDRPFWLAVTKMHPSRALQVVKNEIARQGWSLVHVPRKFSNEFWLRNITLHRRIVLGTTWGQKSDYAKVQTLAEELTHIYQRKRLGRAKFLARYAIAEWRWAIECSANRVHAILNPRLTLSARAEWMRTFYRLGRLDHDDMVARTVEILSAARRQPGA